MKRSNTLGMAALLAISAAGAPNALAQDPYAASSSATTTVTSVAGTITQLNYGAGGAVEGFLAGSKVLLVFPTNICGGVSTLGAVGNSVTYSGTSVTASSGFESVIVSSFTNNTTKASYAAPSSSSTPTTYGPTSGAVKQLNYDGGGNIDGFVFTPSGASSIFVATNARASSTLSPLLPVGATVSVTGTTSPSMGGCASTGALEAVNAASLTVGGQTIVIAGNGGGGNGSGHGPSGPGGPGGGH